MNHTSCVRVSDLHLTFNQGLCLTLEKSKSLDPAVPEIQRCPVLANRLRVWGALPLTPFGLPVRVWIGSNRSQGIAVNLQKNVFLNYCWILKELNNEIQMQGAGRRGYKGERRYDSVASADPWLAPHVYASRRLAPGWVGCSELGQKSWIIFWLMGSHWS